MFPVILTDNGSEFSNPRAIEEEPYDSNVLRTLVFYCHAGASFEKGACEVNHEFIRRIIPKGADIPMSQQKISLRPDLRGRSSPEARHPEDPCQGDNPQARAPEITRQLTMG